MAGVQQLLEAAMHHHQAGRLDEALARYRELLASDPCHVDALQLSGLLAHQRGEHERAVELIGRAIALNGGIAGFHNNLGNALAALGRYDEAERAYRRGLGLAPADAEIEFNLANLLRSQGRLREAEVSYRRVLDLAPRHIGALNNLAIVLTDLGALEEAGELCRTGLAIEPGHPALNTTLGIAVYRESDPRESVAAFQRAVRGAPLELPLFLLGACLEETGNASAAQACFDRLPRSAQGYSPLIDSWEYVKAQRTPGTRFFSSSFQTLRFALEQASLDGLVLEFGVRFGNSIGFIAGRVEGPVHGFDSFQGLPEAWDNNPAGVYSTGGRLPAVPANVRLHVGLFADVLPGFLAAHPGAVRLANIDCDIYSSTRTVLEMLRERLQPGSVLVFDEYLCNPGWRQDEHRALQEAASEFGLRYEYLAFNLVTRQAVVRIS